MILITGTYQLYALLAINTALFSAGAVFIGKYAKSLEAVNLAYAASCLLLANALYIQLIRHSSFGYAYILTSCGGLILAFLSSWLIFHEPIHWTKVTALCLAVTAAAIYDLPAIQGKQ